MVWFAFTVYVRGQRLLEVDFQRKIRANDIAEAIGLLNLPAATGDPNETAFDVMAAQGRHIGDASIFCVRPSPRPPEPCVALKAEGQIV